MNKLSGQPVSTDAEGSNVNVNPQLYKTRVIDPP